MSASSFTHGLCTKMKKGKEIIWKEFDAWLVDMCKRQDVTSEMWQVNSKIMTKKTKLPSDFNKFFKGMSQKKQMT